MGMGQKTEIKQPEQLLPNGIAPKDRRPAKVSKEPTKKHTKTLVSIVLPVFNEAGNLGNLLEELFGVLETCQDHEFEVLVIDDGSTDGSGNLAREMGAKVFRHPTNIGNGAAIKRGIRSSKGEWILLMDGDGQHPPHEIPRMLEWAKEYDMVVGSRDGSGGAFHRNLANRIYNGLASYVTHRRIPDLTSGFRLVRADALRSFVHLLPNTFSYPTTITLAMFRAGFAVKYIPFRVRRRGGKSKIHLFADGSRFFLIILKVATFFAPLRVFLPLSALVAGLGVAWYLITWWTTHRFTNMAVLLLVQSSVLFSLGLISEQIAQMRFDRPFPFSSHEGDEGKGAGEKGGGG